MADTGWLTAGSARNVPVNSGIDWQNWNDAKTSNDSWAFTSPMDELISGDGLNLYNFGASISSEQIIVGIEVKIERKGSVVDSIKDKYVYLMDDTSEKGNSKADTGLYWPSSDTWKTYGGSDDKWGATWTPTQVNTSTFGAMVVPKNYAGGFRQAYCDCIQVKIYYTLPPSTDHLMIMGM